MLGKINPSSAIWQTASDLIARIGNVAKKVVVDVAGVESLDRRRRLPARPAHRAAVADLAAGQSARRLGTPQGRQAHRGPAPSRRHGSAVSRLAVHHLELDRAYNV